MRAIGTSSKPQEQHCPQCVLSKVRKERDSPAAGVQARLRRLIFSGVSRHPASVFWSSGSFRAKETLCRASKKSVNVCVAMKKSFDDTPTDIPKVSHALVEEINRLQAVVRKNIKESRFYLTGALHAAFHAGKLLGEARKSINRHAGWHSWLPWLRVCYKGSLITAQRHLNLARDAESPSDLSAMSLRQACLRLGISIEPNDPRIAESSAKLTSHLSLAKKLTRALRLMRPKIHTQHLQDLAPLYAELALLFERKEAKRSRNGSKSR